MSDDDTDRTVAIAREFWTCEAPDGGTIRVTGYDTLVVKSWLEGIVAAMKTTRRDKATATVMSFAVDQIAEDHEFIGKTIATGRMAQIRRGEKTETLRDLAASLLVEIGRDSPDPRNTAIEPSADDHGMAPRWVWRRELVDYEGTPAQWKCTACKLIVGGSAQWPCPRCGARQWMGLSRKDLTPPIAEPTRDDAEPAALAAKNVAAWTELLHAIDPGLTWGRSSHPHDGYWVRDEACMQDDRKGNCWSVGKIDGYHEPCGHPLGGDVMAFLRSLRAASTEFWIGAPRSTEEVTPVADTTVDADGNCVCCKASREVCKCTREDLGIPDDDDDDETADTRRAAARRDGGT